MKKIIIASVGQQGQIGYDNDLVFHSSEDMKKFKEVTSGHMVLMGRKTFESIGKVLPNRVNIVITKQLKERNPQPNLYYAHSVMDAYKLIDDLRRTQDVIKKKDLFIIGGGSIYEECLNDCDELLINYNDYCGVADTFFPEINNYNFIAESFKDCCYQWINDEHFVRYVKTNYKLDSRTMTYKYGLDYFRKITKGNNREAVRLTIKNNENNYKMINSNVKSGKLKILTKIIKVDLKAAIEFNIDQNKNDIIIVKEQHLKKYIMSELQGIGFRKINVYTNDEIQNIRGIKVDNVIINDFSRNSGALISLLKCQNIHNIKNILCYD